MPNNNIKILSERVIFRLESLYYFVYVPDKKIIETHLPNSKKVTQHSSENSFLIISKTLQKKIIFSLEAIQFWISFRTEENLSKYSLFAVNNAVNKLKITYLELTKQNVINMLKNDFKGIVTI